MSVHTADSEFSFHLPSLSYIDTRWEEQDLSAPAGRADVARRGGLGAWLSRKAAGFLAWHQNNVAARELASMSDRELMDIGINRSDLPRVFDPAYSQELPRRGT